MRDDLPWAVAFLAATTCSCGVLPRTPSGQPLPHLTVRPVVWNPGGVDVGQVRAVADAGAIVVVFSDRGASVLSAGALVASDASKDWRAAGTIVGADGSARWIVGIDGHGRVQHLHDRSSFEDVSARYGLDGARVLGAAALGDGFVGFRLDGQIALADGRHVTRFASPLTELVGGAGVGAGVAPDVLQVFRAREHTVKAYPLFGVTCVAVGPDGRVVAATPRALYATDRDGVLALVYLASPGGLHGLVTSGDHVWFADGHELGIVSGDRIETTTGADVPGDAELVASPTGDVWVLAHGTLTRYQRGGLAPDRQARWTELVGPVFARSCASCHQPDGVAGTDLSTADRWDAKRSAIRERVVMKKTMPPQGHVLADPDREMIRAWLDQR